VEIENHISSENLPAGIAYDSGGVTTSTVTVPLVAALGIGLATNIPGRDPLLDGFGLVAFASLFPMITVMAYGIIVDKFHIKSDTEIAVFHSLSVTQNISVSTNLLSFSLMPNKTRPRLQSRESLEACTRLPLKRTFNLSVGFTYQFRLHRNCVSQHNVSKERRACDST